MRIETLLSSAYVLLSASSLCILVQGTDHCPLTPEPERTAAPFYGVRGSSHEQIKGGGEPLVFLSLVMWPATCEIPKWETKVAFILFSHSTIQPTFWCRQTKRRARRPIVAFTFLNETGFIHPRLGRQYYSAMRIKGVTLPQVLLQCEICRCVPTCLIFLLYLGFCWFFF